MPKAVYHAYGCVKKAAALVNCAAGKLDKNIAGLIVAATGEVIAGKLDAEFPPYVWRSLMLVTALWPIIGYDKAGDRPQGLRRQHDPA
ncbi:MAG TPA: hypothetical protein VFN37_02690 [Candidatus Baltobacteraceae bacterium]|nr:hypothetical protein [Candidatus Baltobacteraceae bacterium]